MKLSTNDDQMCLAFIFLSGLNLRGRLMKLKNVIVYSIYIAQDIAQLDLLHCEQVYEYEIQLLSYIQTSYLVFWT